MVALARAWYAVVGAGAFVMTGVHLYDGSRGSRLDPRLVILGLAIGALSLAAATAPSRDRPVRLGISWLGVLAGAGPFAYLLWIGLTSAQGALAYIVPPVLLAFGAALVLARARFAKG